MRTLLVLLVLILVVAGVFGDIAAPEKGLLQKDWFLGGLFGVAATLIGFALTMVWDLKKTRALKKSVLRAVNEELTENTAIAQYDLKIIEQELSVLTERKFFIQPMKLFNTGFWDVAKINLPETRREGSQLSKLRNLVFRTETCNEQIRSRENYRILTGANRNFGDQLRHHDEFLEQELRQYDEPLRDNLLALKAALEEL